MKTPNIQFKFGSRLLLFLITLFALSNSSKAQGIYLPPNILGSDSVCMPGYNDYYSEHWERNQLIGIQYKWTLSGGGTIIGNNDKHTVKIKWQTPGGPYMLILDETQNGNPNADTMYIWVFQQPHPEIFTSTRVACVAPTQDSSYTVIDPPGDDDNQTVLDDKNGCIKVCQGSYVLYEPVNVIPGSTHTWTAVGGTVFQQPGSLNATVRWDSLGQGSITVTESNNGCIATKTICIDVIAKPHAAFTIVPGSTPLAPNSTSAGCLSPIIFKDLSTGSPTSQIVSRRWDFGDGNASNLKNPTHTYTAAGAYSVVLIVTNECGCIDSFVHSLQIGSDVLPGIICPSVVCEGDSATYSTDYCSLGYTWTVVGGTIQSSYGQNVVVKWDNIDDEGFGYISLYTGCNDCPGTATIKVPVIQKQPKITIPDKICVNTRYRLEMPLWPGTRYSWGVINYPGTVIGETNSNTAVVQFGMSGTYQVHVTWLNSLAMCGGDTVFSVNVFDKDNIQGPPDVCASTGTISSYFLGSNQSVDWVLTLPNASTIIYTGTQFDYVFTQTGTYRLEAIGGLCVDPLYINVTEMNDSVGPVSGIFLVCAGMPYPYSANTIIGTVVDYSAENGTITYGTSSANITWNAFPAKLFVYRRSLTPPYCVSKTDTLEIIENRPNPNVTGPDTICSNTYANFSGNDFSGASYRWEISPFTAGSIVNTIFTDPYTGNVVMLANDHNVPTPTKIIIEAKQCNIIVRDTFDFTILPKPNSPVINAPFTACSGDTVTYIATPGAQFYAWYGEGNVSLGVTSSNTFSFTHYNSTGTDIQKRIKVILSGSDGTTPCELGDSAFHTITITPGPQTVITTSDTLKWCEGDDISVSFSVYHNTGVAPFTYQWYKNSVAISGATNFFYTATARGVYSLYVTDANGCSAFSNSLEITTHNCDSLAACIGSLNFTATHNCGIITTSGSTLGYQPWWTVPAGLGHVVSGQNANSATIEFYYAGEHEVNYYRGFTQSNGDTCRKWHQQKVQVPIVPSGQMFIGCGNDRYNYIFANTSSYMPKYGGATPGPLALYSQWEFNQGFTHIYSSPLVVGTLVNPPLLAGGQTYQVTLNTYLIDTNGGIMPPALIGPCSYTFEVHLPEWNSARIDTVRPDEICEGLPIFFVGGSILPPKAVMWNFDDGSFSALRETNRGFTYNPGRGNPNTYDVTVSILDEYGCRDTSAPYTVTIHQNNIRGSVTGATSICNGPVTLTYTSEPFRIPAALYMWSNEQIITANNFTTVYSTGPYFVTAEDANSCRYVTDMVGVEVYGAMDAPISGDKSYCEGETVYLQCFSGSSFTYDWQRSTDGISWTNMGSGADLYDAGLTAGEYYYRVIMGYYHPSVGTCYDTTGIDTVRVHAPDPPPVISSMYIADCDKYRVVLEAPPISPVGSARYNWSNGEFGTRAEVFEQGVYRLWRTNLFGCISHSDTTVPVSPRYLLEAWFPSGCYQLCEDVLPIDLYGPPGAFAFWDWLNGGTTVSSSLNSPVSPYTITGSGNYSLSLETQLCRDTSDILQLTTRTCNGCASIYANSSFDCNGDVPNSYFLTLDLNNPFGSDIDVTVSFDIGSVSPLRVSLPASSITTYNMGMTLLQAPPPAYLILNYTLPDGTKCSQKVQVDLPYPCGWPQQRRTRTGSSDGDALPVLQQQATTLLLYPNPASQLLNISYSYGAEEATGRSIQVYDAMGRLRSNFVPNGAQGSLGLDVSAWVSGAYIVRMVQDGAVLHTQRVVIGH